MSEREEQEWKALCGRAATDRLMRAEMTGAAKGRVRVRLVGEPSAAETVLAAAMGRHPSARTETGTVHPAVVALARRMKAVK